MCAARRRFMFGSTVQVRADRVVQLGAGDGPLVGAAPGDEDRAVTQLGGGVRRAAHVHALGAGPEAGGRVVDLGAEDGVVQRVAPADHEHPTVVQLGGGVEEALRLHGAAVRPPVRGRVVELGHLLLGSAGDEHATVVEEDRGVRVVVLRHRGRRRPRALAGVAGRQQQRDRGHGRDEQRSWAAAGDATGAKDQRCACGVATEPQPPTRVTLGRGALRPEDREPRRGAARRSRRSGRGRARRRGRRPQVVAPASRTQNVRVGRDCSTRPFSSIAHAVTM